MAKLSQTVDPFDRTTLNTALWTQTTLGSATFSYAAGGASVVFPASTTSSTDGDLVLVTGDLTDSFASLKVTSVPGAGATHTDAVLRVRQNSSNYVTIFYEAGSIFFSKVVAGAQTNITSATYSATTHAWWRIREQGGTTYWETSPDGKSTNWTIQTSQADPVTLTTVDVLIGGLCFGVDATPANFTFSSFNFNVLSPTVEAYLPGQTWINRFAKAERHIFWYPSSALPVNATLAQIAATLTFTGGTQSIATVNNATVAQVAATLTFTGGTPAILGVSSGTVAQVAATLTFTGGTQVAASVVNSSVAQVAATLTFNGGTQVIATVNNKTVAQVAATLTFTGGTQTIATSNFSTVAQVAATLTFNGGTQVVVASQKASVTQVAATLTFTGGTQVGATSNFSTVTQVAATLTFAGGTQVLLAAFSGAVAQTHATLIFSGGIQNVFIPAILLRMIELAMAAPDVLPISITKSTLSISVEHSVLPISLSKPASIPMTLAVDNSLAVASTNNIIPISVVAPAPIAFTVTAN